MIKHTDDFKREAVRIALSSGLSRRRVASDLGVGLSTLCKWVLVFRPADLVAALAKQIWPARTSVNDQENRVLKEERDILKKATQYFASQRP